MCTCDILTCIEYCGHGWNQHQNSNAACRHNRGSSTSSMATTATTTSHNDSVNGPGELAGNRSHGKVKRDEKSVIIQHDQWAMSTPFSVTKSRNMTKVNKCSKYSYFIWNRQPVVFLHLLAAFVAASMTRTTLIKWTTALARLRACES